MYGLSRDILLLGTLDDLWSSVVALNRFMNQVHSATELTSIVGTPSIGSLKKELKSLDEHMVRFIAHSPSW